MPNSRSRPASRAGEHGQQWGHKTSERGYLSIENAASWADVSKRTIKRWIAAGLSTYQAGPREKVLIRPRDIEAFLTRKQVRHVDMRAVVEEVYTSLTK